MPNKSKAGRRNTPENVRKGRPANPIKDQGTSKGRARAIVDQARSVTPRADAERSVNGRGRRRPPSRGAASGRADTGHPAQHGGIRADNKGAETRSGVRGGKRSGAKRLDAASPADRPRAAGGRSRTGRSRVGDRARRKARAGQRTRTG